MAQKVQALFDEQGHKCLFFTGLVEGEGIPSNQLVIVDQEEAALFDPGGELTYTALSIELSKHISIHKLRYVCASHQDPDIITSLPRWLMHTNCKVVTSQLWSRFLPHLVSGFVTGRMDKTISERMIEVPDEGMDLPLGKNLIRVIPAHFLHSVGNFHFYDPVAKVLFSGDVGAAVTPGQDHLCVNSFAEHVQLMAGFHRRYMASNKACRTWVNAVRRLEVDIMIPQHGQPFVGQQMVNDFLDWFEQLQCGVDLM